MADRGTSLLASDEPSPVEVLRPHGASDFVLTADHAGRRIPRRLGTLGLAEPELSRHIAWDIGIAAVTRHLAERLDAAAILQTYSRLVIDCNRRPGGEGSIAVLSEATRVPGNEALAPAEAAARKDAVFVPYHAAIARLLDARAAARRRTVLVAMHSFTPIFKGAARGMHLGILYNRDPRFARILLDLLKSERDLVVGDNAPYRVSDETDYTIPVHGERRGLPHVEIDLRQDLIGAAAGQLQWAERLARLLAAADARLIKEEKR